MERTAAPGPRAPAWRRAPAVALTILLAAACLGGAVPAGAESPLAALMAAAEAARASNDELLERAMLLEAAAILRRQGGPPARLIAVLERAEQLYHAGRPTALPETWRAALPLREELLSLHRAHGPAGSDAVERDCFAIWHYRHMLHGPRAALSAHRCYLDAVVARKGQVSIEGYRALSTYANALFLAEQTEEAEQAFRRAIDGLAALGASADTVRARTMSYFSAMLSALGRLREYEEWLRRALDVLGRTAGEASEDYLGPLGALANFYADWGRVEEADLLVWRAYAALDSSKPDSFLMALYAWRAGGAALRAGQADEAYELFSRALRLHERHMSPRYLHLGTIRLDLADAADLAGRTDEAMQQRRDASAFFDTIGQGASLQAAQAMLALGLGEQRAGRNAEALQYLAKASDIAGRFADAAGIDIEAAHATMLLQARMQRPDDARRSGRRMLDRIAGRSAAAHTLRIDANAVQRSYRPMLSGYLALEAARTSDLAGAWQAVQLANASATSLAVTQMAISAGTGDRRLAGMLREQGALLRTLRSLDDSAASVTPDQRASHAQQRRAGESRLQALRDAIARDFPRYAALAGESPITLETVQARLGEREALIVFHFARDAGYLWVLKRHGAPRFVRLGLGAAELEQRLARLRRGLGRDNGSLQAFDVSLAHGLFRALLGQAEDSLAGIDHLSVVPDGALMSFPLEALVTANGAAPMPAPNDYSRVSWLARRFTVAVLPSVPALHGLRTALAGAGGTWSKPFAGFGDPVVAGPGGAAAALPPLPGTATELRRIAADLSASPDDVWLGERATESRLRTLDLMQYKVLAFATHGLKSGELPGLREPALLLSPERPGGAGDGLLTASEIAALRTSADWVILSACNTAGADGRGGEAMSGLARAFFHAGARSALVSHWYVETSATALLTTRMFGFYASHPLAGKSDAHRQAMLALIDDPARSHPALWAAFSLVGDGLRH